MKTPALLLLAAAMTLTGCAQAPQTPPLHADATLFKIGGGEGVLVTNQGTTPWTELKATLNSQPCRGTPATLAAGDRLALNPEDCGQTQNQTIKSVGLTAKEGRATYTF